MYFSLKKAFSFELTLPHMVLAGVYAYVTLKDEITEPEDQIIQELKDIVKQKIAGYAVPEMIQVR